MLRNSPPARIATIFSEMFIYARRAVRIRKGRPIATVDLLHPLMMEWAQRCINHLGMRVTVSGDPPAEQPVLLVGNHMSYVDIPLLMSILPTVFVSKDELAKWPIVGDACRSVGIVFVKRDSKDSRKEALAQIAHCFQERKQTICIFPSGTTTIDEAKPWRWGAFELAYKYSIPIQPFCLNYQPTRKVAFLLDDALLPHLWQMLREKTLTAQVHFGPVTTVTNPERDTEKWQRWNQEVLAELNKA